MWFNRRSKRKQQSKPLHKRRRLAGFERLEVREVLDGTVIIDLTAGNITLIGDNDNNEIEVRQSSTALNTYIFEGLNNTQLNFSIGGAPAGGAPVSNPFTVGGVTGNFVVDLNDSFDTFRFLGKPGGGDSTVPGNLTITNEDHDLNVITDVTVNGNLTISRGDTDFSELEITGSTVNGNTGINNNNGPTKTTIDSSIFLQGGGGPFLLNNGSGADVTDIRGNSQFGFGITINNGAGGSRTTFTGASAVAGPGTTQVYGPLTINNGTNVLGTLDIVMVNSANAWGAVNINNGSGNTETMITGSNLGSNELAGGPVLISNADGADVFSMTSSTMPWGLLIDNDAGGTTGWDSTTQITSSFIGTRIFGPSLPPPAAAGDAFMLLGGSGRDLVNIIGTRFNGTVNLSMLGDGANEVNITANSLMGGLHIVGGKDRDIVMVDNSAVTFLVDISLGNGNDDLFLTNIDLMTEWPNPSAGGVIMINGGGGPFLDTTNVGALAYGALGFEVFVP